MSTVIFRNRVRQAYVRKRSIREMLLISLIILAGVGFVVGVVTLYGMIQRLDAEDQLRFATLARIEQPLPADDRAAIELFGWDKERSTRP